VSFVELVVLVDVMAVAHQPGLLLSADAHAPAL